MTGEVDAVLNEVLTTRGGAAIYAVTNPTGSLWVRWESGDIQIGIGRTECVWLTVAEARPFVDRLAATLNDPPPLCTKCCGAKPSNPCPTCGDTAPPVTAETPTARTWRLPEPPPADVQQVTDTDGGVWDREGDFWWDGHAVLFWGELLARGPLTATEETR